MNITFEIMDVFKSPVIAHDASWAGAIPERIRKIIPEARLFHQIQKINKATYPEIVAFVMTASLSAPLTSEWVEIYTHVSCHVCEQYFKEDHWDTINAKRTLSRYEMELLNGLQCWIYNKRRGYLKNTLSTQQPPARTIALSSTIKKSTEYLQLKLF